MSGCSFHYTNRLNHYRDQFGLQQACRQNQEVKRWFRKFHALCLLPPDMVRDAAEDLMVNRIPYTNNPGVDNGLDQFCEYFRNVSDLYCTLLTILLF